MDDLISRQDAIDALIDRFCKGDRDAKLDELVWAIEKVPSAQKKGTWKWIDIWDDDYRTSPEAECSKCHMRLIDVEHLIKRMKEAQMLQPELQDVYWVSRLVVLHL